MTFSCNVVQLRECGQNNLKPGETPAASVDLKLEASGEGLLYQIRIADCTFDMQFVMVSRYHQSSISSTSVNGFYRHFSGSGSFSDFCQQLSKSSFHQLYFHQPSNKKTNSNMTQLLTPTSLWASSSQFDKQPPDFNEDMTQCNSDFSNC